MTLLDILVMVLLPAVSAGFSFAMKANYLISTLLFFGLPALWCSLSARDRLGKVALFSLLFSFPFTLLVDYLGAFNGAWWIPHSLFPWRLFRIIPVESFFWGFLYVYAVIIYYVHFLDKGKPVILATRMKYLLSLELLLLMIFFLTLWFKPSLLKIKFAYFWIGTILVFLPAFVFLSFYPEQIFKFFKCVAYFFYLTATFEYTALRLGQWFFPGEEFIGWIKFFGYRIPVEEALFWFILSPMGILSYYKYFDDDENY